uniref:Uncharacterized protein n=1 Tax=Oryza punctata TaxID=4537 RepID=A0A0E0ML86_ORYPU
MASALPRADPTEVAAVAFPVGGSSGPLPPPPLPEDSPADTVASAASPLDPTAETTSAAPVGGSGQGDCG